MLRSKSKIVLKFVRSSTGWSFTLFTRREKIAKKIRCFPERRDIVENFLAVSASNREIFIPFNGIRKKNSFVFSFRLPMSRVFVQHKSDFLSRTTSRSLSVAWYHRQTAETPTHANFQMVQVLLRRGRRILYSSTPEQVAGSPWIVSVLLV